MNSLNAQLKPNAIILDVKFIKANAIKLVLMEHKLKEIIALNLDVLILVLAAQGPNV